MSRLLVVEDDETIGSVLESSLRAQGHQVGWQRTGRDALRAAAGTDFDLVLLDLGLPDLDGVEVCRQLRASNPTAVLVILTARTDEMDVVVGLEAGADDYLTKPVRLAELLARVRAHLRRPRSSPAAERAEAVQIDDLRVNPGARRVFVGGKEIHLRPKEFELLALLAAEAGRVVTREQIMSDVWDEHWFGSTKTLDTHVSVLRQKLGRRSDGEDR